MNNKFLISWLSVISAIGVFLGILFVLFDFNFFPTVPSDIFFLWTDGSYGATFIGLNVILFLIGRYALLKNDAKLMTELSRGIFSWLIIESVFALYQGMYFDLAVHVLMFALIGFPMLRGISLASKVDTMQN